MNRFTSNTETKPGIYTTEFWSMVIILLLNNLSVLPIPDRYTAYINFILPAAYFIARGIAKQGIPNVDEDIPERGPVTTYGRKAG